MMRWANFADSHWYLDSMGVKAAAGYSVFCRQDFVGIDYGMIDCATCLLRLISRNSSTTVQSGMTEVSCAIEEVVVKLALAD
jgi:hypothetical protein